MINIEIAFGIIVQVCLRIGVGFVGVDGDNDRLISSSFETKGEYSRVKESVQILTWGLDNRFV
jgi:hypothetical protein